MSASAYRPHRAWESPLYHAVAEHLATFLAGRQLHGRPVPFFIVRDFRAFLDCGVPTHGFLRVLKLLHVTSAGRARAAGGTARRTPPIPSEAKLARRDRQRRLRTTGISGASGRPGSRAALQHDPLQRRPRPRRIVARPPRPSPATTGDNPDRLMPGRDRQHVGPVAIRIGWGDDGNHTPAYSDAYA